MKRLILSADVHPIQESHEYLKYANAIKTAYSELWGSSFQYIQYKPNIEGRHSNWARIPVLHKYIDSYDEILWLDSDVIMTDNKVNIFNVLKGKLDSGGKTPLAYCVSTGKTASSSAIVLDCFDKEKIKQFLNDWWNDANDAMSKHPDTSIVWNSVWQSNIEKKNKIHLVEIDISNEKNGILLKVDEKYSLTRAPVVKKHFWQLINKPSAKRIAMVMRDQNFYSNGAGQNCIFMRHSLEAAGFQVDFVTNKDIKITSPNLPYPCFEFSKLNLDDYYLFIFGTQILLSQSLEKVRAKGIKCVMFNPSNVVDGFHMENFLYTEKKETTPLFETTFHTFSDEIWQTDNHKDSTFEYMQVINKNKVPVKLVPLTWEPLFISKDSTIPFYKQRSNGKVDIVIMEPNLGYCKSAWIPLVISEKFYLDNPEKLNKVYLFCAPKKNATAMGMIDSLMIGKEGKVRLMDRMPINDIFTFFSNPAKNDGNHVVFISHNINVPLNYAYFDILYAGFPFIHNSPLLKEKNIGYFYDGIFDAAKLIESCMNKHDITAQNEVNSTYLAKIDPYNPKIIADFKELATPSKVKKPNFQFILVTASKERRRQVETQLDIICPDANRYFIEPDDPPEYIQNKTLSKKEQKIIYCTRSHYKAIELASAEDSAEFSIVLEDDVSFHKNDFLKAALEIMDRWDEIISPSKMVSLGWIPGNEYDSYLPAKHLHILKSIGGYKLLNDRYVFGTQSYLIRKKDLLPFLSTLIKPTFEDNIIALKEQKIGFSNESDMISCDYVLPKMLDQRILFPPIAIETETQSLIGHAQFVYWEKYFCKNKHLKNNYFSYNEINKIISAKSVFQIIVITCSTKRKTRMEKQLQDLKIDAPLLFFDGWTPDSCPEYLPDGSSPSFQRHVCCARSHISALEIASQSEFDFSIIIEDDAAFHKEKFIPAVNELIDKWDSLVAPDVMASIGWLPMKPYNKYVENESVGSLDSLPDSRIFKNFYAWGLQAYIVRKSDISKFIPLIKKPTYKEFYETLLKKDFKYETIDSFINRIFGQTIIFPPLVVECGSSSTIIENRGNSSWDLFFKGIEEKKKDYYDIDYSCDPPKLIIENI